ncbi:MAG: hypothetical protein WBW41_08180 [Verrucomicrobiia bacterium]
MAKSKETAVFERLKKDKNTLAWFHRVGRLLFHTLPSEEAAQAKKPVDNWREPDRLCALKTRI